MSKKIVINACFGGFGLSHAAVMRYAELKGIKLYTYKRNLTSIAEKEMTPFEPGDDADTESFLYLTYFKEPLENDEWDDNAKYFSTMDIKRDDPVLVQVVEELGKKANDRYSALKIVEIPDDVDWYIDEYDGLEHVSEKHSTWY